MQKVILITGATSGIGKATALFLAEKGYKVYGTGRNPKNFSEKVTLLKMDIRQEESIEEAISSILKIEKKIDILINNAGVGISGSCEETPTNEIENLFKTNFFGTINVIKKVLENMRQNRSGLIINITSIAGYMGLPFRSGYSASKGALLLFSESLRMEVKDFNIKVCTLAPGDVATDIASRRFHTPNQENSPYFKKYEFSLKLMNDDVNSGQNPSKLAEKIYQIINTKNPKVHYKQAAFLQKVSTFLKGILPSKTFEKLLMNHYKI